MRPHLAIAPAVLASAARTLSSLLLPRSAPSRGSVLARVARRLIEADARARDRRRLENRPDWLRADAGLPPRSRTERAMRDLYLPATLLGRT